MTAAQLVAPERFELVDVPSPAPGRGQVRVAVEGCGVCASNLPAWRGRPWFSYPLAPGELGHEGWGVVDAVGEGVDGDLVGRRVATISERAYAEHEVVGRDDLVMLPDGLTRAPLEPFGCLFNILDRAALPPEQPVAVVGLGFIGLGMVRLAARQGVPVIALSSNRAALERARGLGAQEVIETAHPEEAAAALGEVTRGRGCTTVIECTGHQAPLDLAGNIVAEGGRLVIAGFHQDGPRQVDLQQWNWKGIDVVNAHERSRARIRRGMEAAARALSDDPGWVDELVTHRFALAGIGAALEAAGRRPSGFVKAAVLMSRAGG